MTRENEIRQAFERWAKGYGFNLRHMPESVRFVGASDACWYYSVEHNNMLRSYQAATAAAEAKYLGVIKKLGSVIPCYTGGTFENDPPDAIIDAATRYITASAEAKYLPVLEKLVATLQFLKDEAEGDCNSRCDSCDVYVNRGMVCPECPMWVAKEARKALALAEPLLKQIKE